MSMTERVLGRPGETEYATYAKAYVDLVRGDDVLEALGTQLQETLALLRPVDDYRAAQLTYAPGKWTLSQVVGHISDTERIFSYRALRIARGDTTPLPGFEQDDYVRFSGFEDRRLSDLLGEFETVRASTISLFRGIPHEAWNRRGVVSQFSVTVRGLAFHTAGHEMHHVKILREKYLL
jgi:hypothetical protein